MIGQAQIQQAQPTIATGFGGIGDHMNSASSLMGFQHCSLPSTGSHAKLEEDLRKQVEFYFGPSNYPNDGYLQKLAASYGGSVPTVVILGFPKVRAILSSAPTIHQHGINHQQAEIQLLSSALETSKLVHLTPDGLWILAPVPPHYHQQIIGHHHNRPYGMTVPAPHHHHNTKGNICCPYQVMPLHHNSMMFSNGSPVPYGIASQYPLHSLQPDQPQRLLQCYYPCYHASMNGSNQANHSCTNHNNNHKHQHQYADPKHHQYQYQKRHPQGSTKSEGPGQNISHGNNKKTKNGRRKKMRSSWTAANSVASTGSGGGVSGSNKHSAQQGPLKHHPISSSLVDNGAATSYKDPDDRANGTAAMHSRNSSNANKQNNKNKRRQSVNQKEKNKQPGRQPGRPAQLLLDKSSEKKLSEILLDEHFPSLPNQKGQKQTSLSMAHVEKVVVSGVLVEDTTNKKFIQPYAQALLRPSTRTLLGLSSEDSTATTTTANTLSTEMEKLAMDAMEEEEDMCW